jgi:hypothetical protein
MTIFRPSGKYGPPIINKNVQDWNIESMSKLFISKSKDSKKFRKVLFAQKEVKNNRKTWQTTLKDYSISNEQIKKSHEFTATKILHPKFHDKKFRLLARKTQFNNQLSKHQTFTKTTCYYCENFETGQEMQI